MAVAAPAPPRIRDPRLTGIWDKVQAGERLSRAGRARALRER